MSEAAGLEPPSLAIRRATDADVLAIAKVHILSWRETYPYLLPEGVLARLSIADEAIRWQRTLDRPRRWRGNLAFVAELNSIIGYGSCQEQRTAQLYHLGFTGEVGELYVLRSAQRRGAGSGLMMAMASGLAEQGHRAMSLWVLEENGPARRFYEKLGGRMIAGKRTNPVQVAYGWSDLRDLIV